MWTHAKPPLTLTTIGWNGMVSVSLICCVHARTALSTKQELATIFHKNVCFPNMCGVFRSKMTLSIAGPVVSWKSCSFPCCLWQGRHSYLNFIHLRLFRSAHHNVPPVPCPGIQVTAVDHSAWPVHFIQGRCPSCLILSYFPLHLLLPTFTLSCW